MPSDFERDSLAHDLGVTSFYIRSTAWPEPIPLTFTFCACRFRRRPCSKTLAARLVCEKRTEFRVNPTRLKSVFSNLINNAVEAIDNANGQVTIGLKVNEVRVIIEVKDNGRGMPAEVCEKLGKTEVSYGKKQGNGIGVLSTARIIQGWQGYLTYASSPGVGTVAYLILPLAEPPAWFCPELILQKNMTVIILDDDVSIHHIWSERFERYADVKIEHLSTPDGLASWLAQKQSDGPELLLMDHELLGFAKDGLDLIQEHHLQERAVLVTSRAQEAEVLKRSQGMGVRIVPKSAAPSIPLRHVGPE